MNISRYIVNSFHRISSFHFVKTQIPLKELNILNLKARRKLTKQKKWQERRASVCLEILKRNEKLKELTYYTQWHIDEALISNLISLISNLILF